MHHFGAFYRGSWRVSDWLHGRMDGAAQLVRLLLSPQRLRQCGYAAPASASAAARAEAGDGLLRAIEAIAVPAAGPERAWFAQQWDRDRAACQAEGDDATRAGRDWLRGYESELAAGPPAAAALWRLWGEAGKIGAERIGTDAGSDTFARISTHLVTVATNIAASFRTRKPVAAFLTAFRGYALTLWAMVTMLTRKSRFGTRAAELAVAAGGVLLAVAVFVPGMPLAFILAGAVLLLAGLSAAALLTSRTRGIGWRLLAVAVLTAAAFGGYAYWDHARNGTSATVWTLGVKIGIVLLAVLIGWWVARARPRRNRRPGRGGH